MKIRSLKQTLHWLFLAVGLFSVFMLVFSVSTYLGYARDGYGLEMSVSEAWLDGNSLALKIQVENPGGLDIVLGANSGNLTINDNFYYFMITPEQVQAGDSTYILIYTDIAASDLETIRTAGLVDFSLNLSVTVQERDVQTNIHFEVTGQGVDI